MYGRTSKPQGGDAGGSWISEPGNLFWSVVLRGDKVRENPEKIVFVAAMAIVNAVKDTLPDPSAISIKWPNDVLINGAKFSGTLAESNVQDGWAVVCIGINFLTSPTAAQTIYPATCLLDAGSSLSSVEDLCERLSFEFVDAYDLWLKDGLDGTFATSITKSCGSSANTSMLAAILIKPIL